MLGQEVPVQSSYVISNVDGGIVSAMDVPLGVPGFSSLGVLRLWAPCSCVWYPCSSSVAAGNHSRVNVGSGIVFALALALGVRGYSSFALLHQWARCSSEQFLAIPFGGMGEQAAGKRGLRYGCCLGYSAWRL